MTPTQIEQEIARLECENLLLEREIERLRIPFGRELRLRQLKVDNMLLALGVAQFSPSTREDGQ